MTISDKIAVRLAVSVICLLLLTAGCAGPGEKTAAFKLRFTPQDSTTYRLTTEAQQSVNWQGPLPDKLIFKPGSRYNRIEMTFTQQIQSVDDEGNALAKITIEALKYSAKYRDNPPVDFDSSREKDQHSPLAMLIGQSYTIEITPAGEVTKVDAKQADVAIRSGPVPPKMALTIIEPDAIRRRHGTLILPETDRNRLRAGDSWSAVKAFSFGRMGPKSYERIYTIREIEEKDGRRIAVADMNTIPAPEMAGQLQEEQAAAKVSKMFDNTETYTGWLKLDLTAGKIEHYLEKLQSEWVAAIRPAKQKSDKAPVVLTMGASRFYKLEKID